MKKATLQIILLFIVLQAQAQKQALSALQKWPKGYNPKEVGLKIVNNFIPRPNMLTPQDTTIHYAQVCTWYGSLTFAQLTKNKALQTQLINKFDTLMLNQDIIPTREHVDYNVFGIIPLEIAIQTKNKEKLAFGKEKADTQWKNPLPNGMSKQTRYWIDDMYMISVLQTQAYRATKDPIYLERAALQMVSYLDSLQKDNGLFFHGNKGKFFWGRGNGWMAAGMTELLRELPKSNPNYPKIMSGYTKMMNALLKYQDKKGLWHQLVDYPEAWEETSSSAMFTFAFITGVKNGWLNPSKYIPATQKAWKALVDKIDEKGNIHDVCAGMGQKVDAAGYLSARKVNGDYHGQAPVLWCASALLR